MAHPKKIEGDALMKEGASCLATGFFKWTPDVDGAARAYGKAATCYKTARELELAKTAFLAEAANLQRSNMMFGSARAFENAGLMAKELGQMEEAASHLEAAARCFEQVDFQKAADTLALAASVLPPEASTKKIELLSLACDRLEAEDRTSTLDPFRALVSAYLSINNYQLAIETIERLMPHYQDLKQSHNVHKSCRDIVIIHMCSKGPADAEQAWQQFTCDHPNFGRSSDGLFCTKLLDLVKYGSQEELAKCIEYEMCSIRIPEVARLLHRLQPLGLSRDETPFPSAASGFGDGPAAPDDEFAAATPDGAEAEDDDGC